MSVLNLNQQDGSQVQTFEEIEKEREARRRKTTLIVCAVLLVIVWILAMLLWYLWNSRPTPPPPAVEQTQETVVKEETPAPPPPVEEKDITEDADVIIALTQRTFALCYEPMQRPEGRAMYQLTTGGVVLAQSGRLQGEQQLETMNLVPNVTELIVPGSYDAKILCIFYGEKGTMETQEEEITLAVLE